MPPVPMNEVLSLLDAHYEAFFKAKPCQWALKGDQRKALERRPVGLRRDGLLRWVLCRRQAPFGESSWRTDWRWISHRALRV